MRKNIFQFLSRKLALRLLVLITILSITIVGIRVLSKFNWSGFGEDSNKSISIEETIKDGKFIITKKTTIIHEKSAKTLWDWLELSSVLAIPIVLYLFQTNEQKRANKRVEVEKEQADELAKVEKQQAEQREKIDKDIADSNLREEAFQIYIDRMSEILTNNTSQSQLFSDKYKNNPIKDIARVRTTTILRRLENDIERQYRVLHFLDDTELLQFLLSNANLSGLNLSGLNFPNINFTKANFNRANLSKTNLSGLKLYSTDLSEANLSGANLSETNLSGANLSETNLSGANLSGASLERANLSRTNLSGFNLSGFNLSGANLSGASLIEANLSETDLSWGDLSWANFTNTNLRNANLENSRMQHTTFINTDLSNAILKNAKTWYYSINEAYEDSYDEVDLNGSYDITSDEIEFYSTDFSGAILTNADLKFANFIGADNLTPEQLQKAKNWDEAIYSDELSKVLGSPITLQTILDDMKLEGKDVEKLIGYQVLAAYYKNRESEINIEQINRESKISKGQISGFVELDGNVKRVNVKTLSGEQLKLPPNKVYIYQNNKHSKALPTFIK